MSTFCSTSCDKDTLCSVRLIQHVKNTTFRLNSQLSALVGCAPSRLPVLNMRDQTRLKYIQPDSRQGRQIIIPYTTFSDCGEITSWSMKGRCTRRFPTKIQIQVWGTDVNTRTYTRRAYLNRTITPSQCGKSVIQFQGLSGLHFSRSNFVGVFLPPSSFPTFELGIKEWNSSRVRVSYAEFNTSQSLTKINMVEALRSHAQLDNPQIFIEGEKNACTHTRVHFCMYTCTCTH